MKIMYCVNSTFNSGGMERILMYKANYLADVLGYEVCIVTTDQQNKSNFFKFSDRIKFVDFGINYDAEKNKNLFVRLLLQGLKKRRHKKCLASFLNREHPDICVSMFCREMDFLTKIKDGSRKILEFHFSKNIKLIEAPNKIIYFAQKLRLIGWRKAIRKYDAFVVLTQEDKEAWGNMDNIRVIPNFLTEYPEKEAALTAKRVISVGRLSYQKGFDYLVQIWNLVHQKRPEWQLCVFGNGEEGERKKLEEMIRGYGLEKSIALNPATSHIGEEYLKSSIYAMTSRFEGLPMVLLEVMSYGLPIVSFSCPCGPKDVVVDSFGSLVPLGDIEGFAQKLIEWMDDEDRRHLAGIAARESVKKYMQLQVMKVWDGLFRQLISN